MSNLKDFVIEDGKLKKYVGRDFDVVIPNNVEIIDEEAFDGCEWIETLVVNEGVSTIGERAFHNCQNLISVALPASLIRIGRSAFGSCVNLQSINIPENVEYIGNDAFSFCKSLTSLVLPDSVKTIGALAFSECKNLNNVNIPSSITQIGDYAFEECEKLVQIRIGGSLEALGPSVFLNCTSLRTVVISDSVKTIASNAFYGCDNIKEFVVNLKLERTFPAKIIEYISDVSAEDMADIIMVQKHKFWERVLFNSANIAKTNDALNIVLDRINNSTEITETVLDRMVRLIAGNSTAIKAQTISNIYAFLLERSPKHGKRLSKSINIEELTSPGLDQHPAVIDPLREIVDEYLAQKTIHSEVNVIREGVLYRDSKQRSSREAILVLATEYAELWEKNKTMRTGQISSFYQLSAITELKYPCYAEKIAEKLDPDALASFAWDLICKSSNYRVFSILAARFATETTMTDIVSKIKSGKRGRAKEKYWAENLEQAIYYSDTKAAVQYIEAYGDFERYVRLRGMSVQEYRDVYSLPDFGFDANGVKRYVVDGKVLEIRITSAFDLAMTDAESGKAVKSISKKTAEGTKAAEEFATLKKELKDFYKKRIEYMKKIYITGEKISAKLWNETYLSNPLFRPVVEALIWQDEGKHLFEVSSGKCRDITGADYISVGEVTVAHVLDMTEEQIVAWQNRLIAMRKSLLIEQVWEPVAIIDDIKEIAARYKGIEISKQERNELKKRLKVKAIDVRSEAREAEYDHRSMQYVFDPKGTMLIGKHLRMDYVVDENSGDTTLDELCSFSWKSVGKRELNSVLFELDRITVRPIIAKDDGERLTEQILSKFTVAQISKFIAYAAECGSVNCTATLLDYKNKTFGEAGAFDMFVLE